MRDSRTCPKDPEWKYTESSTVSLTLALDGVGWPVPCPSHCTAGKDPVPIIQEVEWAPWPVWVGAEG